MTKLNKHLCILVPLLYDTLFAPFFCSGAELFYYFIIIKRIGAEFVSSNGVIWEEFSKQHQHQSTKKALYSMPNSQFTLFLCKSSANLMYILAVNA